MGEALFLALVPDVQSHTGVLLPGLPDVVRSTRRYAVSCLRLNLFILGFCVGSPERRSLLYVNPTTRT